VQLPNASQLMQIQAAPRGLLVVGASSLWRIYENGDLDPTFGAGGHVSVPEKEGEWFRILSASRRDDGGVRLVGEASNDGSSYSFATLMSLGPNGEIDLEYGIDGQAVDRGMQWFVTEAVFHERHRVTMIGMETERQGTMVRRYWY
jgi:hypothetical protein